MPVTVVWKEVSSVIANICPVDKLFVRVVEAAVTTSQRLQLLCMVLAGALAPQVPPALVMLAVRAPVDELKLLTAPCMKLAKKPFSINVRVCPMFREGIVLVTLLGAMVRVFVPVPMVNVARL